MTNDDTRLHAALSAMVDDAKAPSGPHIRSLAPRHRRWFSTGTAVGVAAMACVAIVVAVAVVRDPDGVSPARSGETMRSAWGSITFEHPRTWFVLDLQIQSRGTVGLGPYLGNVELRDPCTGTGSSRECGPLQVHLSRGQVVAGWRSYNRQQYSIANQQGLEERQADGRVMKVHTRPAEAECVRDGGTWSVDIYLADDSLAHTLDLHACLNDVTPTAMEDALRAIVLSVEQPRSE